MTAFVTGTAFTTEYVKITGNTAVDVLTVADRAAVVTALICTENAGSTPDLTISVYDGTNTFYLRNAKAMTAKETVNYTQEFRVPPGWKVRVTSNNASGNVDVIISYFNPAFS